MVKSLALNFWLNYIKMLKIVIIVSNILGWNAKRTSLVQFHSVTPELAIISYQNYTQNPDTNTIFRISRQTISLKSIANNLCCDKCGKAGHIALVCFSEMYKGQDSKKIYGVTDAYPSNHEEDEVASR